MALGDNALAYYKLESDGTDSVGTLGTATGTAPTYNAGKINNGGSFASASSQYLETATFAGTDDWSCNLWFNPTTNQAQVLIGRDDVSTARVFDIYQTSATEMTLYAWGTSQAFHQTSPVAHGMSTGTWYMWTAVWDNANNVVTLYKNATSFSTITLTGNQKADHVSSKLSIARLGNASAYNNGKIDEIGYWARALTSSEITELYNSGSPGSGQQYPFSTTNRKSLNTNVNANIKSYNTNAIANVKSINTNA